MSDALLGIDNVNAFFTEHYLAAILASDLQQTLKDWKASADGGRTPPRALAVHQTDWFRYRERLDRTRASADRVELHLEAHSALLELLGYRPQPERLRLDDYDLPLLVRRERAEGPLLWAIPAVGALGDERPFLSRELLHEQLAVPRPELGLTPRRPPLVHEKLVTRLFDLDSPPRFLLLLGEDEVVLLERGKWAEQRWLRFDLDTILGRKESATLEAMAAILHHDSLTPPRSRAVLLDTLDQSSHKHAFAVSEDLKYALQASIERLGNAVVQSLPEVFGAEDADTAALADQLSMESLRYLYRLLFLFFIEARPELGYAPMGSEPYLLGYSLERLRELEQLELSTDEARGGTYIQQSLSLLFRMIHDGARPGGDGRSLVGTFGMEPLRAHLFDPARTALIEQATLPNEVLRDILEWMSLSRSGKDKRRGRISYATLGINQLGAVYEALLSYRGFIARTELFEVKPADQAERDVLQVAYFVPREELERYTEKERVYAEDGNSLRRYPPGSFIYRLAGRDRQTSASYYTPEVLTHALVKYTLAELLDGGDGPPLPADEILRLTVCEPAMGSAAFLNEAVSQLADAYLQRKQAELGERIAHDRYAHEKQRVKMYLADRNVYGVDLNPVAVELAEVSLWLNTIHAGGFVPWFGSQLVAGNSLVGARREVYSARELSAGPDGDRAAWAGRAARAVGWEGARPKGSVYHFLLGDPGMAVYGQGSEGKPIQAMEGEALAALDAWRRAFCAPVSREDARAMVELSDAVDRLWRAHARLLGEVRERTRDPLGVYGHELPAGAPKPTTTAYKDAVWEGEMLSVRVRAASPLRRLKLVMDYWSALWFWPLDKVELLPTRDEYLADLSLLLMTEVLPSLLGKQTQFELFAPTSPAAKAQQLARDLGVVDVDKVVAHSERLQLVEALARRYRFHHWELHYADVFAERGGFDLVLGNPPWIKVQWTEQDVLGDMDPLFVLRKLSSTETAQRRDAALEPAGRAARYREGHEAASGLQGFLTAPQNYPELRGIQPNLYKVFLPVVWRLASEQGHAGLVHPEGVYDDPKGGRLREALYPRLRRHYQFVNEKQLFPDVDHHQSFSLNIFGPRRRAPRFLHLANLFTPSTIDACHEHRGRGPVPGIKEEGSWALEGHRQRVIEVSQGALELFAAVYDDAGTPWAQARLPALHARTMVPVLERFQRASRRLAEVQDFMPHDMWHESRARKLGIIDRAEPAAFPDTPAQLILSGPHFFVGNPHYKTPRAVCTNNSHYDVLDLTALPEGYLPRTNYLPACSAAEYAAKTPVVPWSGKVQRKVTEFYRVVVSAMVSPPGERTLQPAVVAPDFGHIDNVNSYSFSEHEDLLATAASWSSVPIDFFVKSMGVDKFRPNVARQLPLPTKHLPQLFARTLLLNALTTHYAPLWARTFDEAFTRDRWTKADPRLDNGHFTRLSATWDYDTPLRTDYARRQALVELDVLMAMALGLTLQQLQDLYRAQFYVLRGYEADTWYDQKGRVVFTPKKGVGGLDRTSKRGDPNPGWKDVQDLASGTVTQTVLDDTHPGGPREREIVYHAPFDRCDREADYATAWAMFEGRLGGQKMTP